MTSKAAIYTQTGLFFTLTVNTEETGRAGASANNQVTLPFNNIVGCSVVENGVIIKSIENNADNIITFGSAGVKTIEIRGVVDGWKTFTAFPDAPKFINIVHWGQLDVGFQTSNFRDCPNLTISATDIPNFGDKSNYSFLFDKTPALLDIPNLNLWDFSEMTNFGQTFSNCGFNTYHGDIDTSNVTTNFRTYSECPNYNQPDNHNLLKSTNFNQYRFNNFSYNQVVNMDIPLATNLNLMMRGCSAQAKNITLINTDLVQTFNQTFLGMPSMFAAGATISVSSFAGATNITNMFFGTKLTTANIDQILNQWVNTISTATGLPMANFTTDLGGSIPSAQGLLDIATLQGRGWTINNIGA